MQAQMWRKLGRLDLDAHFPSWASPGSGLLTPQPFLRRNGDIRLYGGFRDTSGASRIGYFDLDPSDPLRILRASTIPALDVGERGTFDDNGVILGDVIRVGDEVRLYYVGFQIPQQAKFLAFSGVAISMDDGETFRRVQPTPILDRSPKAPFIRAIHTVLKTDTGYRMWLAAGDGWERLEDRPYPRYHIRTLYSRDGLMFESGEGDLCLLPTAPEYRIGRPKVTRLATGTFEMRCTSDTTAHLYASNRAVSDDGVQWRRVPEHPGLERSAEGWDSTSVCYVATIEADGRRFCFYGGNRMGGDGIGCAEWVGVA